MDPRSISIVMPTIDRSPKQNYLSATISNLARGGIWFSPLLKSFDLAISTNHFDYVIDALRGHASQPPVWRADHDYLACENAGRALKIGSQSGAQWILFCEDDIDVCSKFLESVAVWLDKFANDRYGIYPFASPYDVDNSNSQQSAEIAWESFYGTQCFAIRSDHAISLGSYLLSNPLVKGESQPTFYDLMIADWLRTNNLLILCSNPSFVEHIGRESVCTNHEITHRSPSWPGRDWSYVEVVL